MDDPLYILVYNLPLNFLGGLLRSPASGHTTLRSSTKLKYYRNIKPYVVQGSISNGNNSKFYIQSLRNIQLYVLLNEIVSEVINIQTIYISLNIQLLGLWVMSLPIDQLTKRFQIWFLGLSWDFSLVENYSIITTYWVCMSCLPCAFFEGGPFTLSNTDQGSPTNCVCVPIHCTE